MASTLRHKRLAKNMRKCRTMKDAMIKSEYKESYANSGAINKTKGWKKEKKTVLEQYLKEEQRLLEAAQNKDLSQEEYNTIINALDKIRKQIQLLSDKNTGNMALNIQISKCFIDDTNDLARENSVR